MTNPYLMPEPSLISFSGGRTSGYMLYQILQAHGGKLPKDVRVAFMNTGKEREQTLQFVKECGERWDVEIAWLEYGSERDGDSWKPITRIVTFATASRQGEPFAKMIERKKFLPNAVMRFCTTELKIRTVKRWMMDCGYEHWYSAVGIRADEPGRFGSRGKNKDRWETVFPLADADVCVEDIMAFWAAQPFDLQLRQDEGNCDLCFLKGQKKLKRLIFERPESTDWWIEQERLMSARAALPILAKFNKDRSYTQLRDSVFSLPLFEQPDECSIDDEIADCHCTD